MPASSYVRLRIKGSSLELALSAVIAGTVTVTGEGSLNLSSAIYVARDLLFPFLLVGETDDKKFLFHLGPNDNLMLESPNCDSRASSRKEHSATGPGLPNLCLRTFAPTGRWISCFRCSNI